MFKDDLNPNLKVYVEWSNEVWNAGYGFDTFHWITSELALPQNAGVSRDQFIAEQISTDFSTWSQAYAGQSSQLVRVVSWQAGDPTNMNTILSDLAGQFDAVATAAYVTPTAAQTAGWSASTTGDDVLDAAFADLSSTIARHPVVPRRWPPTYSAQLGRTIPLAGVRRGPAVLGLWPVGAVSASPVRRPGESPHLRSVSAIDHRICGRGRVAVHGLFRDFGKQHLRLVRALQYQDEPVSQAPKYQALLDAATGAWGTEPAIVSVTSYHNDQSDTGQRPVRGRCSIRRMSTATSSAKLFTTPVDGNVYAQPLYVPDVTISTAALMRACTTWCMSPRKTTACTPSTPIPESCSGRTASSIPARASRR